MANKTAADNAVKTRVSKANRNKMIGRTNWAKLILDERHENKKNEKSEAAQK